MNTDCDCGDSQADPPFVSVALGDFSRVKARSSVCNFLKTSFNSTEIFCAVLSGPTYYIHIKAKRSRCRPGVAQKVGRDIALLFHHRGTRRG